jgi:hypothetical protein
MVKNGATKEIQTMWTVVKDEKELDRAMALARGSYQRDLLNGHENLSGSSLRGNAKLYGAQYRRSRNALLSRMTEAGIDWDEIVGDHNRRILVIGGE